VIRRDASGLFWKMFLGMYIAFLIAYICFYIHADGMDSRFGLSVGSLFAVIGNKYIIDSALPETSSFTLVDTLHGLTLFFIFAVITSTAYSLKLVKQSKIKQARRFDMIAAQSLLLVYLLLNFWFIWQASRN
jgi:ABC-type proline/glycine betaine transport system permease subunit